MLDLTNAKLVAGVDEAGRGPLAGSVVAAAVILADNVVISGLTDSKKLSAAKRARLEPEIKQKALFWAVAEASQIERRGLYAAARPFPAVVFELGLGHRLVAAACFLVVHLLVNFL